MFIRNLLDSPGTALFPVKHQRSLDRDTTISRGTAVHSGTA